MGTHPEASAAQLFLGRDAELAALGQALEAALAGAGSVALLTGEPGIGKTRLAEEVGRTAAARGAQVRWGRVWEVEGAPPGWPWAQVVRSTPLEAEGPELRAALAPLLPLGALAPAGGLAPADTFRVAAALVALLERLAAKAPQVLVLDDLHAADQATLALLEAVAREARRLPLLVLGTAREAEARAGRRSAALVRLARHGLALPLGRLDGAATARLVARVLGPRVEEPLASQLAQASEGNPLFAEALGRLAASRGAALGAGGPLPDTIRETLEAALGLLAPSTRRALEAAAVLGREGAVGALEQVAQLSPSEARAALDEAWNAGVLEAAPAPAWRFSHALMRDAAEAGLAPERRAALHARAARVLSSALTGPERAQPSQLAHHLFAAGAWAQAAEACARAGGEALLVPDLEEAARWFERGLEALDRQGGGAAQERAGLLLELGAARIRQGQLAHGKPRCLEAAALARAASEPVLFARAALALGWQFTPGRPDAQLVALLEEALAGLPLSAPGWRARVMARLGAAMMPTPEAERPMRLAREAVALAREQKDPRLLAEVMATSRAAFTPADALAERRALDEELAALALSLGERALSLQAQARLALDCFEQADGPGFERELAKAEALAQALKLPVYRWRPATLRLCRASADRDEAEFARCAEEVAALSALLPDAQGEEVLAFNRALRARALGRAEDARAELAALERATLNPWLKTVMTSTLRALDAARGGELQPVREALERIEALGLRPTSGLGPGPAALAMVGECYLLVGDRASAEAAYLQLLRFEGKVALLTSLPAAWGPVDLFRARLAAGLGRREDAERHQADAEAACLGLGAGGWLDAVRAERGARVDARAAASGAAATAPRPAAAAGAGGSPGSEEPRAGEALRVAREGELWTVSWRGHAVRLKDGKGLRYLEALAREPGRELHVADLVGAPGDGAAGDGGAAADQGLEVARGLGDAGELLDARARAAYQRRLAELDEVLGEAERFGDPGRLAKARAEREALADELARALGLGGRSRKAASGVERARVNVQRRLKDVIERVREASPELGRHLEAYVRTGTYCSYQGHAEGP